jgi:hypothetical protein
MYPFGGIILAPFIAGYLASVLCRLRVAKGLKAGYGTLAVSVGVAVVVVWVVTFGEELFKRDNGKVAMWVMLLLTGIPSTLIGSVAAAFIINRHRDEALGPVKSRASALFLYVGVAVGGTLLLGIFLFTL